MQLTNEDWSLWKANPATKAFFAYLDRYQTELQKKWTETGYLQDSLQDTYAMNVKAFTQSQFISDLLQLDFDQIAGGSDE